MKKNYLLFTLLTFFSLTIAGCAEDIDDIPCIGDNDGTPCDPATSEGEGVCIDEACVACTDTAEAFAECATN